MVTGKQVAVIVAVSLLSFCGYLVYDSGDVFPGAEPPDDNPNQFWVRIDGNDSCNGQNNMSYVEDNTDCAWLTVGNGVSTIAAGQTLRVQTGTYNESVTLANSGNATHPIQIIGDHDPVLDAGHTKDTAFTSSGKEYFTIDGITIRNYNLYAIYAASGATVNNLTLKNNTVYDITDIPIYIRCIGHGTWENLDISNNLIYNSGADNADNAIYITNNGHNSTIANNIIHDVTGAAIAWGGNYTIVQYNTIYDMGLHGITTGNAYESKIQHNNISNITRGVRFDYNTDHNSIINNTIVGARTYGIELYPGSCNFLVENNTVQDCAIWHYGIYFKGGNDTVFRNNVIDTCSLNSFLGGNVGDTTSNLQIYNNTFKNGHYGMIVGYSVYNVTIRNNIYSGAANADGALELDAGAQTSGSNYTIHNNVFYDCAGEAIGIVTAFEDVEIRNNIFMSISGYCIDNTTGKNITVSYNSVYNNGTSPAFDNVIDDNTIYLNPLFANVTAYDFHLNSTVGRWNGTHWVTDAVSSPCIGAGDPADDYSNEPAPNGARINMGAYGNTVEASKSATGDSAETFVNPVWVLASGAFVLAAGWLAKRWGNRRRKRQ